MGPAIGLNVHVNARAVAADALDPARLELWIVRG
jgi:hypothetical protein